MPQVIKSKETGMSDEEILKAFKFCLKDKESCDKCKVYDKSTPMLSERFIICRKLVDFAYEFIKRQKAKIEQLTEELANERNAVITFQESANAHRLKVGKVMKQNAKLKKQVDELKEQKGFWEGMHDRVCGELEELQEEKSNTDLITQIYVLKNKLEQAVKDTAKEIYQKAEYLELGNKKTDLPLKALKAWIKEYYGVEVKVEK